MTPRETHLPGRDHLRVIAIPVRHPVQTLRRFWPVVLFLLGLVLAGGFMVAQQLISDRRGQDVAVLGTVVQDQNTALASAGLPTVDPTTVVSGTGDLPTVSITTETTTATVTVTPDGQPTTAPGARPTVTATVVVPGPAGENITTTVTAPAGAPVTITAPGAPPVTVTLPAETNTVTATETLPPVTATTTVTEVQTTTSTVTETAPGPVVTVTETASAPGETTTVTVTETTTPTPGGPDGPADP